VRDMQQDRHDKDFAHSLRRLVEELNCLAETARKAGLEVDIEPLSYPCTVRVKIRRMVEL